LPDAEVDGDGVVSEALDLVPDTRRVIQDVSFVKGHFEGGFVGGEGVVLVR